MGRDGVRPAYAATSSTPVAPLLAYHALPARRPSSSNAWNAASLSSRRPSSSVASARVSSAAQPGLGVLGERDGSAGKLGAVGELTVSEESGRRRRDDDRRVVAVVAWSVREQPVGPGEHFVVQRRVGERVDRGRQGERERTVALARPSVDGAKLVEDLVQGVATGPLVGGHQHCDRRSRLAQVPVGVSGAHVVGHRAEAVVDALAHDVQHPERCSAGGDGGGDEGSIREPPCRRHRVGAEHSGDVIGAERSGEDREVVEQRRVGVVEFVERPVDQRPEASVPGRHAGGRGGQFVEAFVERRRAAR